MIEKIERDNGKPRLFVDMDGVLAEWKNMTIPSQIPLNRIEKHIKDTLYSEDYYYNLKPYKRMVNAIKDIIEEGKVDVYITSCVLPEDAEYPNSHPQADKNKWLDKVFDNMISPINRIFVPDGEPKKDHIPFKLKDGDLLLDDYTKNLNSWVSNETCDLKAIKVLNGINDTHESWTGERVTILSEPEEIKMAIYDTMGIKAPRKSSERTISAMINGKWTEISLTEAMIIKNNYEYESVAEYLEQRYSLSEAKINRLTTRIVEAKDEASYFDEEIQISEAAYDMGIDLSAYERKDEKDINNTKILIVGRTASGKDSAARILNIAGLSSVVSYTTRPMRENEIDGREHYFIPAYELKNYKNPIARTVINGHTYFATEEELMKKDVYIIDPEGMEDLLNKLPDVKFAVLQIDRKEELRYNSFLERGESELSFQQRNVSENAQFSEFENNFDPEAYSNICYYKKIENNGSYDDYAKSVGDFLREYTATLAKENMFEKEELADE